MRTRVMWLAAASALAVSVYAYAQTTDEVKASQFNHGFPVVATQQCRITVNNTSVAVKCPTRLSQIRGVCMRPTTGNISIVAAIDGGANVNTGYPLNKDEERCYEVTSARVNAPSAVPSSPYQPYATFDLGDGGIVDGGATVAVEEWR